MPDLIELSEAAFPTGLPPCRLDIAVLGAVRVGANGREIPFKSRRARAVLAYLALAEGFTATRERLCGLFWGDAPTRQAQNSLRQIVRELNLGLGSVGYRGLRCTRLALSLDPATISVDLASVLADARQGITNPTLLTIPRAAEAMFAGFDDFDGVFHAWLRARQQTVHDLLLRELQASLAVQGTPPGMRQQLAQAMVNLDPANEAACRILMQARAETGDVAGALRAYDGLQQLLLAEHQVLPADATIELLDAIKSGAFDPALQATRPDSLPLARQLRVSDRTAPSTVTRHSHPNGRIGILVQRFECVGVADDRLHLLEGFRHDLISCLVRFRDWFIADGIVPTSTDGSAATARYVMNATAYAAGETISLVLTLREQDAGVYVWSDRLEITFADWFSDQQRVVRQIAVSMRAQLARDRLDSLTANPNGLREAYDFWLLGQSLLQRYNPNLWNRAVSLFESAIHAAPGFAPAYSSLVHMNNVMHLVHPGLLRDPAKLAVTLQTARHAVTLDPRDARALLGLGWTLAMNKRFDEAAAHMRVATELNPIDAATLVTAALFEAFTGQGTRAQTLARQSFALTTAPAGVQWQQLGFIRFLAGDYAGALGAFDHAPEVTVVLPAWRAAALHHLGRHDAAREEAGRFLARMRANWFSDSPATDIAIGRWMLHLHPISRPDLWEQLHAGLAGSGIPDGGLRFNEW